MASPCPPLRAPLLMMATLGRIACTSNSEFELGCPWRDTKNTSTVPSRLFGHISSNSLFHVKSPRWTARNFPNVMWEATDCSSLVEAGGGRVKWVEGDPRLLKVTTKADLEQVAAWL